MDSSGGLDPRWRQHIAGGGLLERADATLRFVNVDTSRSEYTNAQIDDYQGLPRRCFPWRPPLQLTVRARFSHPSGHGAEGLSGTAGFGFWNDPFLMTENRLPTLPRALWFFYASSESDIKLDLNVPGYGWKAATIDAWRPLALLLAPLALPSALLMNLPPLYRALWPSLQRALRVRESATNVPIAEWHSYVIKWGLERATFSINDRPVLENAPSPRGPLGFVMWLDNQYMIVKPWGRFGWGLLEAPG
ncbi:MAG: hypothetical protein PVI63_09995, partial [Anaerolineae bacterium]